MDAMKAIMTRKTVREYDSAKKIEADKVEMIVRAGMNAPSAMNQRAWKFLTMTDHEAISGLTKIKERWRMLHEATLAVGLFVDKNISGDMEDSLLIVSASLAAENMILAAHNEGIESCYIGIDEGEDYYGALMEHLHVPAGLKMIGILAMGYPKTEPEMPDDRFEDQKWVREHF